MSLWEGDTRADKTSKVCLFSAFLWTHKWGSVWNLLCTATQTEFQEGWGMRVVSLTSSLLVRKSFGPPASECVPCFSHTPIHSNGVGGLRGRSEYSGHSQQKSEGLKGPLTALEPKEKYVICFSMEWGERFQQAAVPHKASFPLFANLSQDDFTFPSLFFSWIFHLHFQGTFS